MKIYLASDHAGCDVRRKLVKYLESKKHKVIDMSACKDHDDYPPYAFKVAENVTKDKKSRGILICGSGTGMVIAANKVKGIRAIAAYDEYSAKMSRSDNDCNVLGLRGRKFSFVKIKKIVDVWLKTKFSQKPRHKRRLKEIAKYEK